MDNMIPEYSIFNGSPFDVYVHWLILSLGIGVLVSGVATVASCRGIAGFFHLIRTDNSAGFRFYRQFFKYHAVYWWAFWFILVLHLLVTVPHLLWPVAGEPYGGAHWGSFITSITNLVLVLAVFTSCRSFVTFVNVFTPKSILENKGYLRFYRYHNILWWLIGASVTTHVIFGLYHALKT